MTTEAFERHALGEALRERLGGRKPLAALFTTYSFDPGFFELHVLPLLFARGFSKEETVRAVQLDEELRSVPVAVYFDRGSVNGARGGGSLGFQTFGIRRADASGATKGCFHPKLCLVLVQDSEGEESLVVGVLSANLTEAGHWTNVECAWFDEVTDHELCRYQGDLAGILRAIREEARLFQTRHEALERILKFVNRVEAGSQRTQNGWFQTRLYYGQQKLGDFLRDELGLPPDTYHLEVISPFFDDGTALQDLRDALQPKSTRVYLPLGDDNAATCSKAYFERTRHLPNTVWAKFVDPSYLKRSKKASDDLPRSVHAKVYRLWAKAEGESRELLVLGSVNLTSAAHSPRRAGNFEISVLLESRDPILRPFLTPIDHPPTEFAATSELDDEEPTAGDEPCPLLLRFHWTSKRLDALWDAPSKSPPIALKVSGLELTPEIPPLDPGAWVTLPSSFAESLVVHLPRTSLVHARVAGTDWRWIVVQEEDLTYKPSLLLHLTVEEILRYWSALSDAQRQALLERADIRRAAGLGRLPRLPEQEGMFDRFAGVFHAFERLREHVEKAVAEKRFADAGFRLFGAKHDSLPSLLERVAGDEDDAPDDSSDSHPGDPSTRLAVRYATLLSAQRLLRQLEKSAGDFLADHRTDLQRLRAMLDAAPLRHRVATECGVDGEAFLTWFDRWFVGKGDREPE